MDSVLISLYSLYELLMSFRRQGYYQYAIHTSISQKLTFLEPLFYTLNIGTIIIRFPASLGHLCIVVGMVTEKSGLATC